MDVPERLEPRRLVEELAEVLALHFADAEHCLGLVASRRRDLLPAVVDIRADHIAMAQTLADLRLLAADPARWGELPSRSARFLANVGLHHEAEAALIQDSVRPVANVA